jgi:SAM-dependent methyltransferase
LRPPEYALGSDDAEVVRLDHQAASIAGASEALLRAAGIGPGMRVLDLGTGLGHVAFQLAALVGPEGSVVGVDVATKLLGVAEARRAAAGAENMRFVEGDARTVRFDEPFRAAGANPRIGARLALMLREAGIAGVQTFGIQAYFAPDDPAGPALLAGVVRTLAPLIVARGIATEDELGLDTLEQRLARELGDAGAVMLPPTVAGAWGARAG